MAFPRLWAAQNARVRRGTPRNAALRARALRASREIVHFVNVSTQQSGNLTRAAVACSPRQRMRFVGIPLRWLSLLWAAQNARVCRGTPRNAAVRSGTPGVEIAGHFVSRKSRGPRPRRRVCGHSFGFPSPLGSDGQPRTLGYAAVRRSARGGRGGRPPGSRPRVEARHTHSGQRGGRGRCAPACESQLRHGKFIINRVRVINHQDHDDC